MATLQPRGMQGTKNSATPTAIAKLLGLNRETYRRISNTVQSKRDALEVNDTNGLFQTQVSQKGTLREKNPFERIFLNTRYRAGPTVECHSL